MVLHSMEISAQPLYSRKQIKIPILQHTTVNRPFIILVVVVIVNPYQARELRAQYIFLAIDEQTNERIQKQKNE